MIKLLFGTIITLFASAWIAMTLRKDPGYAMFSTGSWTVETSFAFLALFLIALFIALYGLVRLIVKLWRIPNWTLLSNRRRLRKKARHSYTKSVSEMAAGHWETAEKALVKSASHSDSPALHYLSAAQAAHRLEDVKWRRDLHLREAEDSPDADKLMVQIVRAEFLLDDGHAEQARPLLESLRAQHPHHPGVLQSLAKTYQHLKAWQPLQALLPQLQKQKTLGPKLFAQFQQQAYHGLLESAAAGGSLEKLRALWRQAPAAIREEDEDFLIGYAGAVCDYGAVDDAEKLLREAINRRWSDKLVAGYGMLERGNAAAQLATAENWTARHPDNPYLLLTLGRLASRCQQLDKARAYLERSIQLMPTPDAYQELGELLLSLHEPNKALQCFQTGLRLMVGKPQEKQGAMLPAQNAQQLQGPEQTAKIVPAT
ncbi:MAG: hypothetical protein JNK31_07785 [Candidatus Competibacter sp.]|nr:hypothetical protein [Candidatus Competibacter sp.]